MFLLNVITVWLACARYWLTQLAGLSAIAGKWQSVDAACGLLRLAQGYCCEFISFHR
jgi:hypothetical protein